MMPRLRLIGLVLIVILARHPTSGWAQEQGAAVIAAPLEGAIVSGLVPLSGTATHPEFQRYELAFGYDPNPTDTWFSIQDPATSQVINDVLGRWSTSDITDGVYVLRLRVYWSERDFLEAFVHNTRVQNATPTPEPEATSTPTPPNLDTATPLAGSATPSAATATQPLIILPPTSTPRPVIGAGNSTKNGEPASNSFLLNTALIRSSFLNGVKFSLIGFVLLGVYVGVRTAMRSRRRR
jgi:hypothetical protein